jgi:phospholipase D1/2
MSPLAEMPPPANPPIGWLSPELYLRRPPSKNEQYRLDRMLQRAAQRGVRVNVIVYKEVCV